MFGDARRFAELRMTMLPCTHADATGSGYTGAFTVDVSALSRCSLQRRAQGLCLRSAVARVPLSSRRRWLRCCGPAPAHTRASRLTVCGV